MRGGGWKASGDTHKALAPLSVGRAALISAGTSSGLEGAGITWRMKTVFEQVFLGLCRTEPAESGCVSLCRW